MKKLGLIVNPIAGMGGKVGLKGTDGPEVLARAKELGAQPGAASRAAEALKCLVPLRDKFQLVTCPGEMGEKVARKAGFPPLLVDAEASRLAGDGGNCPGDTPTAGEAAQAREAAQVRVAAHAQERITLQEGAVAQERVVAQEIEAAQEREAVQEREAAQEREAVQEKETAQQDDTACAPGGESGTLTGEETTATHTERAVREMLREKVDLLLFAGGDGTARNIYHVLGDGGELPVIGIPAGVKIHSAVYATSPRNAGELAGQFLQDHSLPLRRAEVMDIDEDAFRRGRLSARLYGYLLVPCSGSLMQHLKIGGGEVEEAVLEAIAEQVVENMEKDLVYIVGPGSTTVLIMAGLGLDHTLLGVDVVQNGVLLAADAPEKQILNLIAGKQAKIIVTVIGGQGYIFGRGNQQISAAVIKAVGRENIIVVARREKILALEEGCLLVDTGDEAVNRMLAGYMKIITGYKEELIYPVSF